MLKKLVFIFILSLHLLLVYYPLTAFTEKTPRPKVVLIADNNTQMIIKALALLPVDNPTGKTSFDTAILTINPLEAASYSKIIKQIQAQNPSACIFLITPNQFPSLTKIVEEKKLTSIFPWEGPIKDSTNENVYAFHMNWNETSRFEALALWAKRQNRRKWSIFVERLDVASKALSEKAAKELYQKGITDVRTFQINPNDESNLLNALKEGKATGHRNILTFLSPLNIIKTARFIQKQGLEGFFIISGWEWRQTPAIEGVHLVTQYPFPTQEVQTWAEKHIPSDLLDNISLEQLIKAYGAYLWLSKAPLLPASTPLEVVRNLERTGKLKIPGYNMEISPKTHLPVKQTFNCLKYSHGKWLLEEKITLEHPNKP